MTVFETERLIARTWTPEDAEDAFAIYGDPEVTRFIGGNTQESVDSARELIERLELRDRGQPFGAWPLELKASARVVGTILLKPLPESEKIEVGWHLARKHWGCGYATEAAARALQHGFELPDLEIIYAVVIPENSASIRVTQRIGMKPLGLTREFYDRELELFSIGR